MTDRKFIVLMVDDDKDDIFAIRRGFQNVTVDVDFQAVPSPAALFDHLNDSNHAHPDLILLDVNMPRMNGFEVLERLKSKEAWAEISVIVLSTSANESDRMKAKQLGATDFETKFSSMAVLEKWVQRVENFLKIQS